LARRAFSGASCLRLHLLTFCLSWCHRATTYPPTDVGEGLTLEHLGGREEFQVGKRCSETTCLETSFGQYVLWAVRDSGPNNTSRIIATHALSSITTQLLFSECYDGNGSYFGDGFIALNQGATVVDIGANIGLFSLFASKVCLYLIRRNGVWNGEAPRAELWIQASLASLRTQELLVIWSLLILQCVGSSGSVYSIEPFPEAAQVAENNTKTHLAWLDAKGLKVKLCCLTVWGKNLMCDCVWGKKHVLAGNKSRGRM
jgi:hypothetical protein